VKPHAFIVLVVLVPVYRDPPSSTYPAAPAIDTTGETLDETTRPLAKVIPLARALRKVG
jgi:hypothetical protein